ncbi:hypothetical protein MBSD_n0843 [Mizugakiibacter sediminis]|uniref:DUF3047 domain-containing protein n=1 Tax=Mizugakiibacter sediminis TaxID=1475481 RepID=A0A0K8QL07_9GAMM|nr:hypothetical protein MBSD_n0843 [Mizugakiibacter sediminis]
MLFLLLAVAGAAAADTLALRFSTSAVGAALPPGWSYYRMSRKPARTRFALVDDAGTTVLRADAVRSAGALAHALDVPAASVLAWRWKVDHAVAAARPQRRSGDDYAARVYVFFDVPDDALGLATRWKLKVARRVLGADLPNAALCYVWDNRRAPGTIAADPFIASVREIVLESGDAHAGRWRRERRDLAADYRAAFGKPAPRVIGIAVASDTDNTQSVATAWFGDLELAPVP